MVTSASSILKIRTGFYQSIILMMEVQVIG